MKLKQKALHQNLKSKLKLKTATVTVFAATSNCCFSSRFLISFILVGTGHHTTKRSVLNDVIQIRSSSIVFILIICKNINTPILILTSSLNTTAHIRKSFVFETKKSSPSFRLRILILLVSDIVVVVVAFNMAQ